MQQLNLPKFDVRVIKKDEKLFIFDKSRKRYVSLTPEEWVRQHFVNYLITCKSFPAGLIGNEITVCLNGMKKRSDSVVYNREGLPVALIEYKRPDVKITQEVFNQIYRYNLVMRVRYLIVSNGLQHYCCRVDYENQKCIFLKEIPQYQQLL